MLTFFDLTYLYPIFWSLLKQVVFLRGSCSENLLKPKIKPPNQVVQNVISDLDSRVQVFGLNNFFKVNNVPL